MNDCLRELMLKAGYAAPELAGRANKLAELIVRECTEVAEEVSPGETTYGWMVAQKIKEHFGVEE